MKKEEKSPLAQLLRDTLSPEELRLLDGSEPPPHEADYDDVFRSVSKWAVRLDGNMRRARKLVETRHSKLPDYPSGRQEVLLRNSAPPLLLVLVGNLLRQSFDQRFDDAPRSLQLAELALKVVGLLSDTAVLSAEAAADLRAEAYVHHANAQRLNADFPGAQQSFEQAGEALARGTGDRDLKADYLSFLGSFRFAQGRLDEAATLFDREVRLRRLLGDADKLGAAEINRGVAGCSFEPLDGVCDYLGRGVSKVKDPNSMLVALLALGEPLARAGRGVEAWKTVCSLEIAIILLRTDSFDSLVSWLKGITYRALGQLDSATRELSAARVSFLTAGEPFRAALVSLDLASVLASRGHVREIKPIAEEAYRTFKAEGLEERALAAFLVFYNAVQAENLSANLALEVANYLVRFQQDKSLRFEWHKEQ